MLKALSPRGRSVWLTGLLLIGLLAPTAAHARRQNIVELAQGAPALSILVDAVIRADLVDALVSPDRKTVFAPTNEAFLALLSDLGFASLEDVPVDALRAILLNHVVEGQNRSRRLTFLDRNDRTLTAIGGLELDFDASPLEVNDIDIVIKDLRASNGVVHVIDEVLLDPDPRPSIVDLAVDAPNLTILVEAATRTGLAPILANGSPFTVFAPTDEAFLRVLDVLGLASLDDVDDRTLTSILLDHVVARELDPAELRRRRVTRALGRLRLFFSSKDDTVNGIPILAGGLEANNGTVYVIDGVLLPH